MRLRKINDENAAGIPAMGEQLLIKTTTGYTIGNYVATNRGELGTFLCEFTKKDITSIVIGWLYLVDIE